MSKFITFYLEKIVSRIYASSVIWPQMIFLAIASHSPAWVPCLFPMASVTLCQLIFTPRCPLAQLRLWRPALSHFSSSTGPSFVSCHVNLVSVTEEKFLSLSLSFTTWAFLWIEVNYFIEWSSVLMKLLINFYLLVTFLLFQLRIFSHLWFSVLIICVHAIFT